MPAGMSKVVRKSGAGRSYLRERGEREVFVGCYVGERTNLPSSISSPFLIASTRTLYPVASTTLFPNSSLGKAWAVRGKTPALFMCFTSPTLYVEKRADAAAGFTWYGMGEPRISVAVEVCITCCR